MKALEGLKALAVKPAPMPAPMDDEAAEGEAAPSWATELADALKGGDGMAIADAFRAAVKACSGGGEEY